MEASPGTRGVLWSRVVPDEKMEIGGYMPASVALSNAPQTAIIYIKFNATT